MFKGKSKLKKYGNSNVITIPAEVLCDEAFPFQMNDELNLTIQDGQLLVTKIEAVKT
jgi:antitoxin component of MazEF toxin-antitoxin module